MSRITSVSTNKGHILIVMMEDGDSRRLDLSEYLGKVRFAPLSDVTLFESVTTDGHYIRWGNKVELSIRELEE